MNGSRIYFKDELAAFEGQGTGVAEFCAAVMDTLPEKFCGPDPAAPGYTALHTKTAFAFLETALSLDHRRAKHMASDRDVMRAATLLHDGFAYGFDGAAKKPVADHPKLMADYVRDARWDGLLPDFAREDIAKAIETHSGQWGAAPLRAPSTEMEKLVHECVYFASRKATTVGLPGVEAYLAKEAAKMASSSSEAAFRRDLETVRQMTDGREWDGATYYYDQVPYVFIDGASVPVPKNLEPAFLTVGEARKNANAAYAAQGRPLTA